MSARVPGKIVTFYSYKGGTGRSMALANVAWILASQGKRVLLVDWDLEAPGLHRYFHPFIQDKNLTSSDGLIEMVMRFEDAAVRPAGERRTVSELVESAAAEGESVPEPSEGLLVESVRPTGCPSRSASAVPAGRRMGQPAQVTEADATDPRWYLPFAKLDGFTVPLNWAFPNKGVLDLLPAGRQGGTYAARVNSFNWSGFYDRLGGGVFLEAVKSNMRQNYDYTLIDSRTGVSDTAGICTVQMPDILVVCFTYNIQSIEGAAAVAGSIRGQRQRMPAPGDKGNSFRIFPVPMRVERGGDKERLDRAREFAQNAFSGFVDHLDERKAGKYWGQIDVPYDPFYAFQEILATVADQPGVRDSVLTSFEQLTSFLTDGEIDEQAPLPKDDRQRLKQLFLLGAKPRSVRDVLTKSPELQPLCDMVLSRQKAWEEANGIDLHLLDPEQVDRLQKSVELFIALLQEADFREFWEASQKRIRYRSWLAALLPRLEDRIGESTGDLRTRERLGGLLNLYYRAAA